MENLEKAQKGSKKELMALYSKTEDKVFKLALALTEKKDGAIKITKSVMTSFFTEKELKLFKSTKDLENAAIKKTVREATLSLPPSFFARQKKDTSLVRGR